MRGWTPTSFAIARVLSPSAASNTIRARFTSPCGVLGAWHRLLEANDPAPAREQLGRRYQHGFRGRSGRYLDADDVLHFPGDRPYRPLAEMRMRDAPDRSFEVARMD